MEVTEEEAAAQGSSCIISAGSFEVQRRDPTCLQDAPVPHPPDQEEEMKSVTVSLLLSPMRQGLSPVKGTPAITAFIWVSVEEFKLTYHNPETPLFTMYPNYGNLH